MSMGLGPAWSQLMVPKLDVDLGARGTAQPRTEYCCHGALLGHSPGGTTAMAHTVSGCAQFMQALPPAPLKHC